MTLLSICQDVTDAVGVQRPSTIVGSLGEQERQLLAFAKETLEELSLMDWPVLHKAASVVTVAAQQSYTLPADFEHEVGDSLYAAARYEQVRGQLTPGQWAQQRGVLPNMGMYKFRIFGYPLKLNVTPIPTTVETLTYEYKSNSRVVKVDTTLAATYTADTDLPLVPEDLVRKGIKWRFRHGRGLDYAEEFNDYENSRTTKLAQQMQFGSMPVAYPRNTDYIDDGYVRENGFGV